MRYGDISMPIRRFPFWLLFLPGVVGAQGLPFSDGFETSALESPAGMWSTVDESPLTTFSPVAAAAHRGLQGVELNDTNGASGARTEAALVYSHAAVGSGGYHLRAWFRIRTSNDLGFFKFLQIATSTNSAADALVALPSGNVRLAGFDGTGDYAEVPTGARLVPGQWHLLELSVSGIGTSGGSRSLAVDGVKFSVPLNLTGLSIVQVHLGEPFSGDARFVGRLDFDDVRASIEPPPTRLQLTLPPEIQQETCAELVVSLLDLDNTAAEAPQAMEVTLAWAGVTGTLFSDARCETPASAVPLRPGSNAATAWVRFSQSGEGNVTASHPDVLATTEAFSVVPLAAAPLRGWSCAATGGEGLPVGALLLTGIFGWGRRTRKRLNA
jgi:hypothetical protein